MALWQRLWQVLWLALHVACCLWVACGIYVSQTQLFHHDECDMTYSYRKFLPLNLTTDQPHPPDYRLYQFFDERDPRHLQVLQTKTMLTGKDGCLLNQSSTTALLFVPGHGGSFQQSRSMGAHGIQLPEYNDLQRRSQVQNKLFLDHWKGDAATLDAFVYEVYAADFAQEGTGLHGHLLQQQANFVADALRHLTTISNSSCNYPRIFLVGHSLGGLVARLALQQHVDLAPVVRNLLTLGTPHAFSVLALHPSVHRLHQQLAQHHEDPDLTLVSIAGGLRDELIPPEACPLRPSAPNRLSLWAPHLMTPGDNEATVAPPRLGMDHRALVWCRNLLHPIRTLIHTLTQGDYRGLLPAQKLQNVKDAFKVSSPTTDDDGFSTAVRQAHETLQVELGAWGAAAAESGLMYNADFLVTAYVLLGGSYAVIANSGPLAVLLAIGLYHARLTLQQQPPLPRLDSGRFAILVIVANALFGVFGAGLQWLRNRVFGRCRGTKSSNNKRRYLMGTVLLSLLLAADVAIAGGLAGAADLGGLYSAGLMALTHVVYIGFVLTTTTTSEVTSTQDSWLLFTAWTVPLIPVLLVGDFYIALIRPDTILRGNRERLLQFLPFLRILCSPSSTNDAGARILFQVIRLLLLGLWCLPLVNPTPQGVEDDLAWPMQCTAIVDLVQFLLSSFQAKPKAEKEHQD